MKHMGTMLMRKGPFEEIVMGNTALVRAMVEVGTRVVTSYPGSPTPEIATAIQSIPQEDRSFYFEFSINEKVATEVAFGAAINGHLSTVFFKSVGLNVASDTFVQLSLMNIIGGMVVVLGDDPGANSSQNEQDNRHFAHMSYTPMLEPSNPTEVYAFYKEAARLSREYRMPVILRLTTHVCHAKEKVAFSAFTPMPQDDTSRFDVANGPYIPLTTEALIKKRKAIRKLAEIETVADDSALNLLIDNQNRNRGIVTMGLPYLSLMDVLEKASRKPDILKLGFVHPIPRKRIEAFVRSHDEVKILEELDNVLEKDIKSLAYDAGLKTRILGKGDLGAWIGEYTSDKVQDVLADTWPDMFPARNPEPELPEMVLGRPPQMCPGCGHRSAFHAIKKVLSSQDITVADIGCHTLGYLPPYEMGQVMMCMGASPGIGSGLSLFNRSRKVVVFLGDSTFFHAGLPGILNSVFNQHPITLILMENGTTAMTGHQDHAAVGENFNGPTNKVPVRQVLEGLGVKHIYEVDTYQQSILTERVKTAVSNPEFSVVIARHPCMLKFTRNARRKSGYQAKQVHIDQELCNQVHVCVASFGCPTFTRHKDGTVTINRDLCIGDGSCLQTCPTKAIEKPR
ncbi:MAG: thiamine pyrophosphate-dependent enzyme [Desulfobacterales bacterium]|nr:thiamine pyrophosphate-dependent enzyme [Desulfobacterales bacterium]MDX2510964.1 thiamine pyrophosphate-dependent enzyme [Desulfobacterales bacterium]